MPVLTKIKYAHKGYLPDAKALNKEIAEHFATLNDDPLTEKTHFFEGRYENIYIDRDKIPAIKPVIERAIQYAAEILEIDADKLQCGFWFNSMNQGDVTLPHTHDDDDELLSAVYYVEVPDQSAQLCLGISGHQEIVNPEEGMMVFFSPSLIHQVTENLSSQQRLSIGMNFGLKKEFKSE